MASIEDIIDEIKTNVGPLAEAMVSNYAADARKDVNDFLMFSKANLALWKDQLENEEITIKEFEYFIGGLTNIAALKILKHTALAQQRILQFVGAVLNMIANVILKYVLV